MRLGNIDPSSYAVPEEVVVQHIDIDWTVDFDKKILFGSAILKFKIVAKEIHSILLDIDEIVIHEISLDGVKLNYIISDHVDRIGSKLTIHLPRPTSDFIDIFFKYETLKTASGLQWLSPELTLGKKDPYLFSQCQPIQARSFLPCQDTPAVKFTYSAVVHFPKNLVCLMSAIVCKSEPGVTNFVQDIPIPSYLIAIVVGNIVSRKLGPISSVWAEQALADDAAYEFADTDKMIKAAESICGPYVWKVYDLVVMPPSFPFGGMENPCLTFVTPALIAKNRSLANVVAHEIAHSWTGNLVTNKNFEQFWLNEGFTVFLEGKILGILRGAAFRDFHAISSLSELYHNINNQLVDTPALTKLVPDLADVSPNDAFSLVPYMKGMTFLRYIEQCLGGDEVFDPFLRYYLDKYKYESVDANDFKDTIYDYFTNVPHKLKCLGQIDWNLWLYGEGMPPIVPNYDRTLADLALRHAKSWVELPVSVLKKSAILQEPLESVLIVEVLDKIMEYEVIVELNLDKINFLSEIYKIETEGNIEIRLRYFLLVIRARLIDKLDLVLDFANSNFRMKYVREIYRALGKWPAARDAAIANFHSVKGHMMKVCAVNCAKELKINLS